MRCGRLRKLKKQEEEDRQREEKRRQIEEAHYRREVFLAEQKPIWEVNFVEEDVPHEWLDAYKHEFFTLPPEDREAMIPAGLRGKYNDAGTIHPSDSASCIQEHGLDRTTKEACRRFVMGKWWQDHGQHEVLAHLDSGVQRDNFSPRSDLTSPTRQPKYVEDVELVGRRSGLQHDNFGTRSNLMSPTQYPKYVDDVELGGRPSGLQRNSFGPRSDPMLPTQRHVDFVDVG